LTKTAQWLGHKFCQGSHLKIKITTTSSLFSELAFENVFKNSKVELGMKHSVVVLLKTVNFK
jgi:hypothetical protein